MLGNYTFLASSALSNHVIDELPITHVTYARALNNHGMLHGEILLDDAGVTLRQLVLNGAVEPGSVSIYAIRDNAYVWGGILWSHTWDAQTGILSLDAAEFDSYLAFRYVMQDATFSGDIATLAGNWVTAAFADGGPPLSTRISLSGTSDTVTVNHWEQHNILDLLKPYSALPYGQGMDFEFDIVSDGSGNPSAQLTISAPRRGVSYVNTGIVWDYPGQIINYKVKRAADQTYTNDLVVTGAGQGINQYVAEALKTSAPYLKMTAVINNRDLTSQAAVNAQATGQLLSLGTVPNLYTAQVNAADFFAAGITVGDELILAVNDGYQHANIPQRLIGYTIQVPDESNMEVANLVLGAVL